MRELRGWLPSPVALAMTGLSLVAAASCTRGAPIGPDSVELAESHASSVPTASGGFVAAATSLPLARASVSGFGLSAGTFALTTRDGHRLTGRYTGLERSVLGKDETASLDLHVEGGSGTFSGASGTLRGQGRGAFTGEGSFRLSLDGQLLTAERAVPQFHVVATGTSRVSCVNGRIVVTLQGSGSATRVGRVEFELQHEVENAGCTG